MIVNNKTLKINEKEIELEYTIRKCIEYDNYIVILLYNDVIIANNVICFDKQGTELWRINDILNIKKPTGNVDIRKESANILLVRSVLGIVFKIDIEKKEFIEKILIS